MATLRIYLAADWKSSPEYSAPNEYGVDEEYIGEYRVRRDGSRHHINIDETWIIRLPNWAQRIGEEFSIIGNTVDRAISQGTFSFGTAKCTSELYVSHEGVRGRVIVVGTNVHDVVELYKMMCNIELLAVVPQHRNVRRQTGIRTRPGWQRAVTYLRSARS